ncbi:MAG: hypothetical protein ABS920_14760 [Sporosarcina sp.]
MNVDAQTVINKLSQQIAQLSVELAIKDAHIEALKKQAEVVTDGE